MAGFGDAFVVAGEFNVSPPAPTSGQKVPFQVDASGNLLVNVAAGGGGGTQYVDGTTQATPTGTVALGKNPSNVLHSLSLDASGNLVVAQGTPAASTAGWPITQGRVTAVTAAWTSATPQDTVLSLAISAFQTVVLSLNVTGTISAGVATFEVSDDNGVTWYSALGYRSGNSVGDLNASLFNPGNVSVLWQFNVTGFMNFRVRLSSAIVGTGTATFRLQASSGAQTSPTTNIAAVGGNPVLNVLVGALTVAIRGGNSGAPLEDTNGVLNENLKNIANSAVVTAAAGVQKVGVVGGTNVSLETTAGVLDHNLKNVGNAAVVTAVAGVQLVGIEGRAGTSFETTAGVLDENIKNVGNAAVVTVAAGVQKVGISGNAAATLDAVITAATAPANALATLAVNNTTPPSLTTGQSVAAQCDYEGSLFVKPIRRAQTTSKATTITNSNVAATVLAAQAAGIFADISHFVITVVPAATADIAFTATLSDGTNSYIFDMDTGALATATADPTQINANFNPPIPATTAATAWTVTLSVNTVTVHITVVAILQKAS